LFNLAVSVEDVLANGLEVYPNPASDQIHIRAAERIAEISISNVAGEILLNKKLNADEIQLNVSAFDPGYYIIRIKTDEGELFNTSFMKK
jgi:hypothetical protein